MFSSGRTVSDAGILSKIRPSSSRRETEHAEAVRDGAMHEDS